MMVANTTLLINPVITSRKLMELNTYLICFFWDLTSLRNGSMKSSALAWEVSSAVELLAASFLTGDEFCANAELVAANAPDIKVITRVITRHFFWFTGSFLTAKLELCASAARNCQQRELSRMHDSNRATSCISQTGTGLELSPRP